MPKVTVILTSFNHEKFIRQAIDSILNQTFSDFELIIWDDASSDNSWPIINSYSDPRIQAFRNEENKRGVYAYNKAITEIAKGEYIAIHHSDDVWEPSKLEKQVDFLDNHPKYGAVFSWAQIINENGAEKLEKWFIQENKSRWEWLHQLFTGENHLNHPSILARKDSYEVAGLYRFGLAQTADAEMWSRLLFHFEIYVIQEKLTKHRLCSDETNTSSPVGFTPIRTENEWNIIRSNFLDLATCDDLYRIFPNLKKKYKRPSGCHLEFLFSMACLEECDKKSAWALGLSHLYRLIIEPASAAKLKDLYDFDYFDLIKMAGKFDAYNQKASRLVSEQDRRIGHLNAIVSERDNRILRKDEQIGSLGNQAMRKEAELATLTAAHQQKEAQLVAQLQHTNQQINQVHQEISEARNLLQWILSTPSWKMTAPLRWLRRHMRREQGRVIFRLPENPNDIQIPAAVQPLLPVNFDPDMYLKLNPDLAIGKCDPVQHYLRHGRLENRPFAGPDIEIITNHEFKTNLDTILIVSHEASRTGAPVLSFNLVQAFAKRYNVIAMLLGGGDMLDAFLHAEANIVKAWGLRGKPALTDIAIEELCERFNFKFAVVNSIESRVVLEPLSRRFVPAITLVHEFAAYTRPQDAFRETLNWSGEVVFSTKLTMENAFSEYPDLSERTAHILPQGRCIVPTEENNPERLQAERDRIRRLIRPDDLPEDTVIVLGAGFVQSRKGVDLFIQSAARVLRSPGGEKCRFVWLGKGFDPEKDVNYSVYLADQIRRSHLENHVFFPGDTSAIETAYETADIFLLSSRLDPLPNVAIDAMAFGLPVVCFNKTTGIADFLLEHGLGDSCVADYLIVADMAAKLVALARSQELRKQVGNQCRETSTAYFDMEGYTRRLDAIALDLCERMRQEEADVQTIVESGMFRQDFSCPSTLKDQPLQKAVRAYVRSWASGIERRKPFPGFHPGIYQEQNEVLKGADPFADFLRSGQPNGPWKYRVMSFDGKIKSDFPNNECVALHLHVYYPELLPEICLRISYNRICPDLFLSVPNEATKQLAVKELKKYKGRIIDIQIVPNRGRDIAPFLTAFGTHILEHYAFVGHLHTKKTADLKNDVCGKIWYRFLLENLVGGPSCPMSDHILSTMYREPKIGMVFPDDPYIVGWNHDRPFAEPLEDRLGLHPLPENFNFPVGTMFWARTVALAPLFNLKLDWKDYPEEPLPYDGSLLHAIERLLPFIVSSAQYQYATTNIQGVTR